MHPMPAALLALSAVLVAANDCPLLAPRPFNVRAVRKQEDEWTADIYFRSWPALYTIILHWNEPTTLLVANHGDIIDASRSTSYFTTIVAQPTGPEDGSARMMLHVQGTHPTTPSIDCFSDVVDDAPKDSAAPTTGLLSPTGSSSRITASPVNSEPSGGAITSQLKSSNETGGMHASDDEIVSTSGEMYSYEDSIVLSEAVASPPPPQLPVDVRSEHADESNCDPSAHPPLELDYSLASSVVIDEALCGSMELGLPSGLTLCDREDRLSLLWQPPGSDDQWHTLQDYLSPQQPHIHIDGLDASSIYRYRLRLKRKGATSEQLSPPTPPLLVDGMPLLHLLSGSAHIQPIALASSAVEIPWQTSVCRPEMRVRVWVKMAEADERAMAFGGDVVGGSRGAEVDSSEVMVGRQSIILPRLRCPRGCRLELEPVGLKGPSLNAAATSVVRTPSLPPISPSGCRLEVRMDSNNEPSPMSDSMLEEQLSSDLNVGLGTTVAQVRLVEQRLSGHYIIFDIIGSDAKSSQQLCNDFSDALFPTQLPTLSCQLLSRDQFDACAAATALAEGVITSRIDASGGLLQLLDGENARALPAWLSEHRLHPDAMEKVHPSDHNVSSSTSLAWDRAASLVLFFSVGLLVFSRFLLGSRVLRSRLKGKSGEFARISSAEIPNATLSDDEEDESNSSCLWLRLSLLAQQLGCQGKTVEIADADLAYRGIAHKPLLAQRISFETVDGECVKSECEVFSSDTVSTIEARLHDIGERLLPTMRITAVSIQLYRPELKSMMEVESSTTLDQLLSCQASEWRVLVLGVPNIIQNTQSGLQHERAGAENFPSEVQTYASGLLVDVQTL